MAGWRACKQCRLAKRKCSGDDINKPCAQCLKRQIPCSKNMKMVRDAHLLPSQGQDSPSPKPDSFDLPQEVIVELVEHYINKLHDRPHSLFHLPTLRKRVQDREVNKALLLAICSLGSRFSADPEVYSIGEQLTAESKRLVVGDFENISLESIQTCILIANICAADAKPSSEALFFSEQKISLDSESHM